MKYLVFLVCFFACLAQQAMAQVDHEPIWVAKHVIFGVSPQGNPAGPVGAPVGDKNGDGYPDVWIKIQENSTLKQYRGILQGRGFRLKQVPFTEKFQTRNLNINDELLIDRNGSFEILVSSADKTFHLTHWGFPSMEFLGEILPEESQFPYALGRFVDTLIPVGDPDEDGYEDVLTWAMGARIDVDPPIGLWAYSLLDGKTLTMKWHFILEHGLSGVTEKDRNSGPVGDVDGDGIEDILLDLMQRDPLRVSRSLVSGADGHVLWNQAGFPPPASLIQSPENRILADLNGDGIRDILVYSRPLWDYAAPGYMTLLSGRTGKPFWKHAVGPGFPSFGNTHAKHGALPVWAKGTAGDVDEDGVPDLLFETQEWTDLSAVFPVQWVYSGRTGELLAREGWVDSFEPWLPNDIPFHDAFKGTFRLGDLDRDGWPEVWVQYLTANYRSHFVVAGRRTLWTKPKAQPGEVLEAHLWIPNGAGSTWRLLGSTGFRSDGTSLHAGVWDTHLAKEDLLHNAGGGLVLLSGSLDAAGKADFPLPVPPDPQLSGQVLYFMAVVDDPAQPDGVLTLSTLAQVHVR